MENNDVSKEIQINENEPEILKKEEFKIMYNNLTYLLTCSKNADNILFRIKLNKEISITYYEINYNVSSLAKVSDLFKYCPDINSSHEFLIKNLIENEKNIKLEIKDDTIKLNFILKLPPPFTLKEKVQITLFKKENQDNFNLQINQLISKIDKLENNQKEFEEATKKNNLDNKNQIKEINDKITEYNKRIMIQEESNKQTIVKNFYDLNIFEKAINEKYTLFEKAINEKFILFEKAINLIKVVQEEFKITIENYNKMNNIKINGIIKGEKTIEEKVDDINKEIEIINEKQEDFKRDKYIYKNNIENINSILMQNKTEIKDIKEKLKDAITNSKYDELLELLK